MDFFLSMMNFCEQLLKLGVAYAHSRTLEVGTEELRGVSLGYIATAKPTYTAWSDHTSKKRKEAGGKVGGEKTGEKR